VKPALELIKLAVEAQTAHPIGSRIGDENKELIRIL
jgi:hypothetical protein